MIHGTTLAVDDCNENQCYHWSLRLNDQLDFYAKCFEIVGSIQSLTIITR